MSGADDETEGTLDQQGQGSEAGTGDAAGEGDLAAVERLKAARAKILDELRKIIVGQEEVIEHVLIAIFTRGHCLLEGVPGLAKTLLISTLARTMSLKFKRIQFTPDLMPADITGTEILQDDPATGERQFKFLPGPIFANVILADEINRTPPKTQAALLEAMQEYQVTAGGIRHDLEQPFFVLSTQNPIEQEGTYPLPEAQLDRFLFKISVDYPDKDEELEIMRSITGAELEEPEAVLTGPEILSLQDVVRRVPVADHVFHFARALVRATRPGTEEAAEVADKWVAWGAGPRASIYLISAGKARAVLHGRYHVATDDIVAVAPAVLRHRVILNFAGQSEGYSTEDIIKALLEAVPADQPLA